MKSPKGKKISGDLNKWNKLMFRNPTGKWSTPNENNSSNITTIAGNWIEAVGTIIAALGSTPSTIFSKQTLTDFNLIGNILEAGGIAIALNTEDSLLNTVGDELQAIGNIVVVAGILTKNEQLGQLLETKGDLLQVVGSGLTINTQGNLTLLQTIANTGNIIQLIGNVMQVFANTDTEEGIILNAVGAWTQAIGAVTTALATE